MNRSPLLIAASILLSSCTTFNEIPDGYSGPRAEVTDSFKAEGIASTQVFALYRIDDNKIPNSVDATASTTDGLIGVRPTAITRSVRARDMQVTIRASHLAAPLKGFALLASGEFYGTHYFTTSFSPKPGAKYVVRGEMSRAGVLVWIEDLATGQAVTDKLASK